MFDILQQAARGEHQEDDTSIGVTWPRSPCHPMSPHVTQTRQLCQLNWSWPQKEIAVNLTDLADFNENWP